MTAVVTVETVVAATTVVAVVETGVVVVTGERKDRVRGKGKGLRLRNIKELRSQSIDHVTTEKN